MSSSQPRNTEPGQLRLHQPFTFCDLEAVAVVTILLGLFQVLLALPLYYIDISLPLLYLLPLCVGAMFVTAGSYTMACERSPSRELMKGCAYTNVAGLVGALCALCVYSVSIHSVPTFETSCDMDVYSSPHDVSLHMCPGQQLSVFFGTIATLLLTYSIIALILHSLLSFSAFKGLKSN
ncbi:uncharacterized protein si:dkey-9i23.16 [Megalops cyprinoides]|uniref:uncharacterized protein si:dkey-9i23.16 n=1 Tax=Megalops cyprinoides TaxID=118141 RepID=UPI0018640ABA|nr:uncharacterized protein si:dkey-9i23.16 [Megalops cyprinoides]XP_036373283.1 uncharacterized protein si:dkey-9i23.16 [Megalops cyprinoides]